MTVNIRGESAKEVARKVASNPLTRGLQGPTVAPIYSPNGDAEATWFTITVIIDSDNLLQAVEHLRAIGGTQSVVVPVRYVFLEQSSTYQRLLAQLESTN